MNGPESGGPPEPIAKRRDHVHNYGDVLRADPYFWLNNRDDPQVIEYLEEENEYTKLILDSTKNLQAELFEEIKNRIKQDDSSCPIPWKDFVYYTRFELGSEYAKFYRRGKNELINNEELLFDVPAMSAGYDFFDFDQGEVSPNQNLIIFSTDTQGRGLRTIQIFDIKNRKTLNDRVESIDGGHAWCSDNKTFFYTRQDPETLRSFQVWKHRLGCSADNDVLVYEEKDETFYCYVYTSSSGKYVIIGSSQTLTDEYRFIDSSEPNSEFKLFDQRVRGLEYDVDHVGGLFYIRTNFEAENFRLMSATEKQTSRSKWKEVLPHREGIYLNDFEVFQEFIVLEDQENGLIKLRVINQKGETIDEIDFGEPTYTAWIDVNLESKTDWVRYGFSSLKTPEALYEYNLRTKEIRTLKKETILCDYDPNDYVTERHLVVSRDGTTVPMSVIYKSDKFCKDGGSPLLLYAYGAYGYNSEPSFNSTRISLLDRGFAYAIAHVRGGQEMGRSWYDAGKLMNKKNTFYDFIDCAEYLITNKYTSNKKLCASGASAGGLLMGFVVNERPELFTSVIADVPWVDCVTTMLDQSIPLTTSEFDEWGDPSVKEVFEYMLSYSPYDNIKSVNYPNILVTTGFNDSQVQYWEPAKWVARLRSKKTDNNLLLLKTNFDSGHGGASGRHDKYRELAMEYAFLIHSVPVK
ncbi:MAG: oligopeptidase B [Verrucomicrobiaceae bacterium TMED76]|nr:MAG: oligopeptidase B [Verrucomicrobiaceae bacterium TMED76]